MSARVQQPVPPQVANLTALAVSLSRDPASAVLDEPPRELHDLEQAPPPSTTKIESQQEEIDAKDAVNLKADQGTAGAGEQHGHLPRVPHPPHAEWQPTHAGKRKPFLLSIRSSVYFMMFTVFMGLFTDMAVYGIIVPVVPFRLEELGYSNVSALTGWLVAVFALGPLILSAPAGILGERLGSRRFWLAACALVLTGGLVLFMFSDNFWLLIVARLIQGIAGIGIWVQGPSLLSDSCEPENIGKVMGMSLAGFSVGSVSGPPLGGVLYDKGGYRAPFYLAIGLCVIDFFCRTSIIEQKRAFKWIVPVGRHASSVHKVFQPKPKTPFWLSAKAMVACLQSPRILTVSYMAFSKGFMFGGLLDGAMTLFLNAKYGLNSGGAGLVYIAAVAPALIASPVGGWGVDKFGPKRVCLTTAALTVPTTVLLVIPQLPLAGFVVCLAASGVFSSAFLVPGFTEMDEAGKNIPNASMITTFALFNLFFTLGCLIGPIISGQVLHAVGREVGWQVMVGLICVLFFFCVPVIFLFIGGYRGKLSMGGRRA